MRTKTTLRTGAFLLLSAAASCGAWVRPSAEPYYAGQSERAEEIFRARLEADDGDWALMANELAMTLDAQGRTEDAWRLFLQACQVMDNWDASAAERIGTVVGRDDTREYRGEPYERALNAIYTGLVAWRRGEADNARACFKLALLRDAEQSEEQFASDFAPSALLAAWCSRALGDPREAADFLKEAIDARGTATEHGARGPAELQAFRDFDASNVLVFFSIGRAPLKVRAGAQGELVRMQSPRQLIRSARLRVDGQELGEAEVVGDVYYQANTRGGRWLDGIREGKAVFKGVSNTAGQILLLEGLSRNDGKLMVAGAASLLASLLTNVAPDLRCWQTLPDTLRVRALALAAGRHTIDVDFLGAGGRALPGYGQRIQVEIPAESTGGRAYHLIHIRSIPSTSTTDGLAGSRAAELSPSGEQ